MGIVSSTGIATYTREQSVFAILQLGKAAIQDKLCNESASLSFMSAAMEIGRSNNIFFNVNEIVEPVNRIIAEHKL